MIAVATMTQPQPKPQQPFPDAVRTINGEEILGSYQIQIARKASSGWAVTLPALHAMVTNVRLIMWPMSRRPYPPASIPYHEITGLREVTLDFRRATVIELKTGQHVYVVVAGGMTDRFREHLRALITPPIEPEAYVTQPMRDEIKRLIKWISNL